MRRIIFFFCLIFLPLKGQCASLIFSPGLNSLTFQHPLNIITPANGFASYLTITIPPQTQNTTILTSFPVVVALNMQTLRTVSNGGLVTEPSGADIVFSTVGPGLTPYLNVDTETYDNVGGVLTVWVQVPIIYSTLAVNIYMAYGNPLITSRVVWSTNTYDSNYLAVYHFSSQPSLSAKDSTANSKDGILTNSPTSVTGEADGALNASGGVRYSSTPFTNTAYALGTIEWGQYNLGTYNDNVEYNFWGNSGTNNFYALKYIAPAGNNQMYAGWLVGATDKRVVFNPGPSVFPQNTWINYAFTWANGGNSKLYAGGVNVGPTVTGTVTGNVNTGFLIGAIGDPPGTIGLNGYIDEFRISNIIRSNDWIKTVNINMSNASGFCQVNIPQSSLIFK